MNINVIEEHMDIFYSSLREEYYLQKMQKESPN